MQRDLARRAVAVIPSGAAAANDNGPDTTLAPRVRSRQAKACFYGPYLARVEVLRRHLGMTEAGMASAIGVTLRTYRAWIAGKRLPNGDPIRAFNLAEATGVSVNWLWSGRRSFLDRESASAVPVDCAGSALRPRLQVVAGEA